MQRKFQEFMNLKQGGRNVVQYSEAFNHLAQYATEYVNTEEKKRYAFLREGAMRQVEEEERKRKTPASASAAPQAKHRLAYTSPSGQQYRTSTQQQF
ncbi:hypothetical protein PR202_gb23794 [Eleusine coracana subsp. coracana]|uniref:Retrotransposon gag domain-containing protein n=1 Tax=Eleusine coracana subsp. coracana TaxID=191504 RepID=A0AAV5FJW6_ELECO|nr:hypothetical protein PR202_gb23794 [Eleusine coracana subsp. coracana]